MTPLPLRSPKGQKGSLPKWGRCISGTVHDQVENKLSLKYEYVGEQAVKNIARPVRVYRVLGELRAEAAPQGGPGQSPGPAKKVRSRSRQRVALAVAVVLLLGAGVVAIRDLYGRPSSAVAPSRRAPAPALADKPSIAVLPFTNMSGNPEQEYFSDGLTEDLITDLALVSSLLVIARNSTFVYKGKPVNIAQISRELGALYVVEGSVRRAGGRVRITAQLIDAATGGHLWAGRYDRETKDLFAVQDEITQRILGELRVKLQEVERERLGRQYTSNLEAWDYFMRGGKYIERSTKEAQARQMWEKALALDPRFASAYAALAESYWGSWVNQWSRNPQTVERALALAQKAVALDDSLASAHAVLGNVYLMKRQYDRAIAEGERGVALSPNSDWALWTLATTLLFAGRPQEALGLMEKAMRLNPHYPPYYLNTLGGAYRLTGRKEEAIAVYKKAPARNPDLLGAHRGLAGIYSESGWPEEARAEVAEILRINPHFTLEGERKSLPIKDRARLERYLDLLRKAGLK